MSKIMIKEVGKEARTEDVNDKYYTACVKRYLNNQMPQKVIIDWDDQGDLCLCVDEAGLFKELPTNFLLKFNGPWKVQKMVGTVVFIRTKAVDPYKELYDYELTDLTDKDMQIIRHILSDKYQQDCSNDFEDYGKGQVIITSLDEYLNMFR